MYIFILQTDHKNLTYLNMEGSPKVQRSAVMGHDFSIQYRPGEDNVVADAFSCLCAIYEPEVLAARTESEESEGRIPPALFMRYLRARSTRRSHRVGGKRRAHSPSAVYALSTSQKYSPLAQSRRKAKGAFPQRCLCAIYEPEVLAARTESEESEGRIPPALFMRYLRARSTRRSHRVGGKRRARIPPALYKILSSVHNSRVGHQGVNAPEVEVFRKHWPKMRAYTKQFIGRCTLCQKMSDIHWAIRTRPFTTAAYDPMEMLNIDAFGPLPADKEGNCYVLAIIDCFSRWLELYPLKGTSAEEAAEYLINHVGRFGIPSKLRSDRGPQFANQCIANLCQLLGVEQDLTIAYSKQENAIVERSNKEIMRYLTAIMFDKRDCDE